MGPDTLFATEIRTRLKPSMSALLKELTTIEHPAPALCELADSPEAEHLFLHHSRLCRR